MRSFAFPALTLVAMFHFSTSPILAKDINYHLLKEIPVGGEGGWDYLSVDSANHRLYVSHGSNCVVIDLKTYKVAGHIENTPGVHGIAIAPELSKCFCSNGRENRASIVDTKTLKTLSKVATGENPDAILYEPSQREVYTFNGRGKSATVFSAESGKLVTTVPLPGKPEFAVEDQKAGRLYNNIEDQNEVVVLDIKQHKVVANWPIAPGEAASGMAIDSANHRLFLGCDNELMLMLDSESGKVVDKVEIGQGVDANAFDPETKLAFASCGDGTVTIAHEESPTKLHTVQVLKTARGSKTMTIDPTTHRIYLAAADFEPQPEQKQGERRQRARMIPGTFKVLVYGM